MAEPKVENEENEENDEDEGDENDETDKKRQYRVKSDFKDIETSGTVESTLQHGDGKSESINPALESVKEWKDLGLSEVFLNAVNKIGFKRPSKIQGFAIPSIIREPYRNFIGQAQSGTGKTAAFLLSMFTRINEAKQEPQAICIAPTRELVRQIFGVAQQLAQFSKISIGLAIPSADKKGPLLTMSNQLIIGTPGTVNLLLVKNKIAKKEIKMLVLDEADEMLDKQSEDQQAIKILKQIGSSKNVQVCLFSATFNEKIKEFARKNISYPRMEILVPVEKLSLDALRQTFIDCKAENQKLNILHDLYSHVDVGQSIIFTQTRQQANNIFVSMKEKGYEVSLLHGGNMYFKRRDKVIDDFRKGKSRILVTTNLLARGVDVLQVSLVINFDLPTNTDGSPDYETYLHRIGRSARYGKPGLAVNFVCDGTASSKDNLQKISTHFSKTIEEIDHSKLEILDDIMENLAKAYERHIIAKKT